jgi:dCMP deaminase
MPLNDRRTWDETWFLVAYIVGMRSRCVRDQVGAVITDAENRVVATGYNGPPANLASVHEHDLCDRFCERAQTGETPDSYSNCPSNHAEINALSFADRRAMEGGTFYVSSAICFTCAKAIANSGVKRVVVPGNNANPHRSPMRSYNFLHRECGIQVMMMP